MKRSKTIRVLESREHAPITICPAPDWAAIVARALGGFESAGYIHRAAAVLMLGLFATHLIDLVRQRRRDHASWLAMFFGPDTMLPTLKDLRDFRDTLKWFVGRGPRPRYGRWTYWEKFDYFAVFWGIAIIGSTGLMLWFSEMDLVIFNGRMPLDEFKEDKPL
ncbi:MAG: hypothetical protein MUF51_07445 [Vicinamibacteria bacterium]|nr:hypothetical protein [Vicinamibacteria bacterium]